MSLISERAGARLLERHGLSLSASQHLLATGIAGAPIRLESVTLYESELIRDVATRPSITLEEFDDAFPTGVAVARLPRGRTISAAAEWPDTADQLAGPWRIGNGDAFVMTGTVAFGEGLSIVLSVSGFLLAAARITALLAGDGPGSVRFDLAAPGSAWDAIRGRRMRGHRGRPVELVGWRVRPGTARLPVQL
ncbi:MAG TPA: hypothetical protein VN088_00635 [Nocardioides sp.]|nr:hypothetical protein [Nocardioides sp.]